MRRYIDHLRKKPDHTKRHIALGVSSLVFLGIMVIMVSTFSLRFPGLVLNNESRTSQSASVSNAGEDETTYDELRKRLGSDYGEVEDLIKESNGVTISDTESDVTIEDSNY